MKKRTPSRLQRRRPAPPKECYFCTEKKEPVYSDVSTLQRFVTDRGKMLSGMRSGLCAKHQRRLSTAIKQARFLALLPFVVRD